MEHYAFGVVLGLMACTFGWAATCDRRRWRRPWWGWLCCGSGLLALGAFAADIWVAAAVPTASWWLVLALALAGGLLWSARMVKLKVEELEFSRQELSDFGLLMAAIDAQGGSALQFLSRPEVLSRLVELKAGALRDVIMEFGGPGKVCILGAANNDLKLVRAALSFEVSLPCLIEAIKRTTSDQIKALLESRLPGASLKPSLQFWTLANKITAIFRATPAGARPKQIPLRPRQPESTLDTRGIGE